LLTVASVRRERTRVFFVEGIRAGHRRDGSSAALTSEINSHVAAPVDILDEVSIEATATLIAQSDLHHKSSHSFKRFSKAGSGQLSAVASFVWPAAGLPPDIEQCLHRMFPPMSPHPKNGFSCFGPVLPNRESLLA
jgi:hypothetical protein